MFLDFFWVVAGVVQFRGAFTRLLAITTKTLGLLRFPRIVSKNTAPTPLDYVLRGSNPDL